MVTNWFQTLRSKCYAEDGYLPDALTGWTFSNLWQKDEVIILRKRKGILIFRHTIMHVGRHDIILLIDVEDASTIIHCSIPSILLKTLADFSSDLLSRWQ
jgi:hypothetical protein